jgi:hypothetical protein
MKKTVKKDDGVSIPVFVNDRDIKSGEHLCVYRKKAEATIVNKEKPYTVETIEIAPPPAKSARRVK